MMTTIIDHPVACLVALLSLAALALVANRLGLIVWLAWLDCRHSNRGAKPADKYQRTQQ
jgi:hypothetical protein